MKPNPMQKAWDEMIATCAREGMPFMLHLWDGEADTGVVGFPSSKTVMPCDIPEETTDGKPPSLVGKIVVQLDAQMLLRILPSLVRETHRALGLVPAHPEAP